MTYRQQREARAAKQAARIKELGLEVGKRYRLNLTTGASAEGTIRGLPNGSGHVNIGGPGEVGAYLSLELIESAERF